MSKWIKTLEEGHINSDFIQSLYVRSTDEYYAVCGYVKDQGALEIAQLPTKEEAEKVLNHLIMILS